MSPDLAQRAARLAEHLAALDAELDWEVLGGAYCDEGGDAFFPPEQREAIRDAGLAFAADLGERLPPRGTSHYLGAAVAELAPILFEAFVLERDVHWSLLPGAELDELRRALSAVGARADVALPRPVPPEALRCAQVDHLWCVSVLTDPDAFPALHDELYERRGLELATGRGDLAQDRARAEALLDGALDALRPPAWLSTSDEEAPLFEAALRARGWRVVFPEHGRLSGIVGDSVRHARVTE